MLRILQQFFQIVCVDRKYSKESELIGDSFD